MKLVSNLVLAAFLSLPVSFANANNCAQKKPFLINEINQAIATYPRSCRPNSIPFLCNNLFNTKLPQLRTVIQQNEFDNLRQIVEGVNANRQRIAGIVSDEFRAPMNSLIDDMNAYYNQCGR